MLNWIRGKIVSIYSLRSSHQNHQEENNYSDCSNKPPSSMITGETSAGKEDGRITISIVNEGDVWITEAKSNQLISDILTMAICHFFDPRESFKLSTKCKLISISQKKVLNSQHTVEEEGLRNSDELLLTQSIRVGCAQPVKLTLVDIKGPSKEDIMEATAHLTPKNSFQNVPAIECQENFQSEIRKVLYSLVEASAKILALSPDAKVVFDGIAARINAKYKKDIDKNAITYLKDLGFTEVQAKYALRLKRNRQVEAMEWLLENSDNVKDDALSSDLPSPSDVSTTSVSEDPTYTINKLLQDIQDFHKQFFEPSARALDKLLAMGFEQKDAVEALRVTGNNQVAAAEWLCGERDPNLRASEKLDPEGPLFKALMKNPAIQLGLHNPKIMLAFLSILENPSSANLWLNDIDTAPVLGQVFKTYHSEKHIMVVNQQVELMQRQRTQHHS